MTLDFNSIMAASLVLFFILDPLGNTPLFNVLLKRESPRQRTRILFRESCIALGILVLFALGGNQAMGLLALTQSSLNIAGGTLLLVISMQMVFPGRRHLSDEDEGEEHFIVPIAMPMIAGPSALAIIMVQSSDSHLGILGAMTALIMAWAVSTLIVVTSPWFVDRLGKRILRAVERLMGMLLLLFAIQMMLNGVESYINQLLS